MLLHRLLHLPYTVRHLIVKAPTLQNGQTHSNDSSVAEKLFQCVWSFWWVGTFGHFDGFPLKFKINIDRANLIHENMNIVL